jgi:uncharacterized protein
VIRQHDLQALVRDVVGDLIWAFTQARRRPMLMYMDKSSPFHPGELLVQELSGVREEAEYLGQHMIRPFLSEQHRDFFSKLPFLVVGSMDDAGQPWASMLFGAPGFVWSPDVHTLCVSARPVAGDPLGQSLQPGAALGLLGIQLQTRRRNRLNGHVRELTGAGFTLDVDQSYGNCPKFISARTPSLVDSQPQLPIDERARLSAVARSAIERADTLFIASASARGIAAQDTREGVDVSHRGGKPGFVRVEQGASGTRLLLPDFPGNNAFNTLGNLARYPRAGLLVPDFQSGAVLQLACTAEIVWGGALLESFAGAERLLALDVQAGRFIPEYMPFRWSEPVPGPWTERTGSWPQPSAADVSA